MVKGITDILNSDTSIQDLVGESERGTKYKVFPNFCPTPDKHPYIVVRQTSKTNVGKDCLSQDYAYDVYCYHQNYDDAELLGDAVESVLTAYKGDSPNDLVNFEYIQYENSRDEFVMNPVQLHVKVVSITSSAKGL
jgi:hypothetical protein